MSAPRAAKDEATITDPSDRRRGVGYVREANEDTVNAALAIAAASAPDWDAMPVDKRAACLDRAAAMLEEAKPELMALCVREAGKTIADAVAEVREAVDFCRYYAVRARADFGDAVELPGPTGEMNRLTLHGRGVFACISPWKLSAGDLLRSGYSGVGGGKCGDCQTGGADATDCSTSRSYPSSGRGSAGSAATTAGGWRHRRRAGC